MERNCNFLQSHSFNPFATIVISINKAKENKKWLETMEEDLMRMGVKKWKDVVTFLTRFHLVLLSSHHSTFH